MSFKLGIRFKALIVFSLLFALFFIVTVFIGESTVKDLKDSSYKVGHTILLNQEKEFYKDLTNLKKESLENFLNNIEKNVKSLRYHTRKIFENDKYIDQKLYWDSKKYLIHLPNNQLTNTKDDISSIWSPTWMKVDDNVISKIELSAMLNEVFEPLTMGNKSIVASYFLAKEGFIRYYPRFDIINAMPKDFVPLQGRSSKPATPKMNPQRKIIWSSLYKDSLGKGLMISVVAPVYIKDDFIGLVGIDITLDNLVKHYITQKKDNSSYSILLDENFKPIALPPIAIRDIFQKDLKPNDKLLLNSLLDYDSEFKEVFNSMKNENAGFKKVDLKDKTLYISFARIEKFGWFYMNIMDESRLLNTTSSLNEKLDEIMSESKKKLFLTALVVFIFLVVATVIFVNISLKPIIELSKMTKAIASGDLRKKIDISAKSEVGELVENFKYMQNSIILHEKSLIEQIRFQKIIMETVNLPIYIKDGLGKYIDCNQSFCDFFGKSKDELIGKTMTSLVDGEELKRQFESDKKLLDNGGSASLEFKIKDAKGELREIIVFKNSYVNHENNETYIVGTYFDVTEIKRAKKEIENFNKELQKRVDEQTQELKRNIEYLKKTQEKLVESEKMASLGGLVAGISHEINTPVGISLTGITHFLDITKKIKKDYEDNNISQQEFDEYLKTSEELANLINTNLKKTARLVASFKQISVDQTSEEKREFFVKEYSLEILLSIKNFIKKTNLDIVIDCDDALKIDSYPGAYSQILTNLILNSLKHAYPNNEEGKIYIKVTKEEEILTLIYKDDGKGIPKENLKKIFDPFFTTNREEGGTGLGLNIIYNIITHTLKGTITCKSEEGKGVEFIIRFNINS